MSQEPAADNASEIACPHCKKTFTADQYGGFDGEFSMAKDAKLGVYQCYIQRNPNENLGGGSFRLEG